MTVKASGQSALILATWLLVCFFEPSLAAGQSNAEPNLISESAQSPVSPIQVPAPPAAQRTPRVKRVAHAKTGKIALRSVGKKAAPNATGEGSPSAIPPSVANANAELTSTLPADNATSLAARANRVIARPTAAPIVSPDQLNDLDRALQASTAPASTVTMATTDPAAAQPVVSSDNESSDGDRTSLIGKIFIGMGVLLTLSSAARMFMA